MARLAAVIPFPIHRVRRGASTRVFGALLELERHDQRQRVLALGVALIWALLLVAVGFLRF